MPRSTFSQSASPLHFVTVVQNAMFRTRRPIRALDPMPLAAKDIGDQQIVNDVVADA